MGRLLAIGTSLLVLIGSAYAADFADPLPRYERAGNGFACHMNNADGDRADAMHWSADQMCMRIGPLYVGMSRVDLEKLLGKPDHSLMANGRENFVYVVHRDEAHNLMTYVVITYDPDAVTDSVQLTGQAWPSAWQFSGLTLGDSEDVLRARLGEPLQNYPSDEPGTQVWDFRPWTFSIEVHDKKITSIRTAMSNDN